MACPLRSGLSVRSGLAPGVEGGPGVIKPRFCAEPTGPGMLVGGGRAGGSATVRSASGPE